MSNWILCSDELPSEEGNYITCTVYGDVDVLEYVEGWNNYRMDDGTVFNKYQCEPGYIEAWQPLPAPYRKEA